ncbi:hypothetical protein VKT23_004531 [Stygiomarasmius scandens]|uniref:Uncharacterized protein n=1 Tax=Marasmiellus scandens TaxID=2682957 RepID=A0ABR1JYX2_9AGAR
MIQLSFVLCTLLLGRFAASAPAASSVASSAISSVAISSAPAVSSAASSTVAQTASSTDSGVDATATVPFASTNPNVPLWGPDSDPSVPAPERNQLGASILGPDNTPIDLQNPDLLGKENI